MAEKTKIFARHSERQKSIEYHKRSRQIQEEKKKVKAAEEKKSKKRGHLYLEDKVLFPKELSDSKKYKKDVGDAFSEDELNRFKCNGVLVDVFFSGSGYFCGQVSKVMKKQIWVDFVNEDDSKRLAPKRGEIRHCIHSPQIKDASI